MKSFEALGAIHQWKPSPVTACNNSETSEGFLMAFSANPAARSNFTFRQAAAGFLGALGLPFVDILSEKLIARVFAKHDGLFGRTSTTAIVLWAFMSQVLRDGKEASCQSADVTEPEDLRSEGT